MGASLLETPIYNNWFGYFGSFSKSNALYFLPLILIISSLRNIYDLVHMFCTTKEGKKNPLLDTAVSCHSRTVLLSIMSCGSTEHSPWVNTRLWKQQVHLFDRKQSADFWPAATLEGNGCCCLVVDVSPKCLMVYLFSPHWLDSPGACVCVSLQIEQVSQLSSLVESQLQYHKQAVQVLDELYDKLRER